MIKILKNLGGRSSCDEVIQGVLARMTEDDGRGKITDFWMTSFVNGPSAVVSLPYNRDTFLNLNFFLTFSTITQI
jgi:hypothetical protein